MQIASDFILEVIRPGQSSMHTVSWVEVDGLTGSFTAGPGHTPLVAILKPGGVVSYSAVHGGVSNISITSGIFTIRRGRALVLLN